MITKMETRLTILVIIASSISFWLLVTVIANVLQECSQYKPSFEYHGRLVASKVYPFKYHFMAALVLKKHGPQKNDVHGCDTTILSRFWTITAAQCLTIFQQGTDYVRLVSDSHNWRTGKEHHIQKYLMHLRHLKNQTDYNIALIEVVEPLVGARVSFLDLPDLTYNYRVNSTAEIVGWSLMDKQFSSTASNFRKLTVLLLEPDYCVERHLISELKTNDVVCAGSYGAKIKLCTYGIGVPLVQNRMLVGIASIGTRCDKEELPGVFIEMSHLKSIIQEVLNNGAHSNFISKAVISSQT